MMLLPSTFQSQLAMRQPAQEAACTYHPFGALEGPAVHATTTTAAAALKALQSTLHITYYSSSCRHALYISVHVRPRQQKPLWAYCLCHQALGATGILSYLIVSQCHCVWLSNPKPCSYLCVRRRW